MAQKQITKFERYFLFVLFFELFAGGGGRLIEFGPISIRQVLFLGVLVMFTIRFIVNKRTREEILGYFIHPNTAIFWTSIAMVVWIAFSAINGYVNGHSLGVIFADVIRVCYVILIIPFIYYIGENRFTIKNLLQTLFFAALIISIVTILIGLIGKFMSDSQFFYFYKDINKIFTGDLYFRPSRGVFHKSHFLVLFTVIIGVIKLLENELSVPAGVVSLICFISIVFSETRGLYLGILVALITYLLVKAVCFFWGDKKSLNLTRNNVIKRVILILLLVLVTAHFYSNSTISRFSQPGGGPTSEQKLEDGKLIEDESLNVRFVLLTDSLKIIQKSSKVAILGNGYGTKIGKRSTGIEMTFVDIFVEQGLVGVVVWLAFSLLPLLYIFKSFLITKRVSNIYVGLLACSFSMLLVTNINPFLNSPIGLGFLLPVSVLSYKLFIESKKGEVKK